MGLSYPRPTPIRINDEFGCPCVLIPLTRGMWTIVDAADADNGLLKVKWVADVHKTHTYAIRVGYKPRSITGKPARESHFAVTMHHVILGRKWVDHKNGDGLDNRRRNLRRCTREQNNCNIRSLRAASGFKGVYKQSTNRWAASITFRGKRYPLGLFTSPEDAARAYDAAALQYHGEFAATNQDLGAFDKVRPKRPEFSFPPPRSQYQTKAEILAYRAPYLK